MEFWRKGPVSEVDRTLSRCGRSDSRIDLCPKLWCLERQTQSSFCAKVLQSNNLTKLSCHTKEGHGEYRMIFHMSPRSMDKTQRTSDLNRKEAAAGICTNQLSKTRCKRKHLSRWSSGVGGWESRHPTSLVSGTVLVKVVSCSVVSTLCDRMEGSPPVGEPGGLQSMAFSRQEYWSELQSGLTQR